MRWLQYPEPSTYKPGDTRVNEKFLYLPMLAAGEWRWLEYARFEEVLSEVAYSYAQNYRIKRYEKWVPVQWDV